MRVYSVNYMDRDRMILLKELSDKLYESYYTIDYAENSKLIYQNSRVPYFILTLTHFIAFTCFPTIIIYKKLPGQWFEDETVKSSDGL